MDRLTLLEQKLTVLQGEINHVLGEVQRAMQGLVKANQLALGVMDARLSALENPEEVTSDAPSVSEQA